MKKLMMFAAAMTIVGGAFAQDCAPTTRDCALIYNVKMALRTSMGRGRSTTSIAVCAPGDTNVSCIRFPNYRYYINGLMAVCGCDCLAILDAEQCYWNPKFKVPVEGQIEWTFIHIVGNKTMVETIWEFEGDDDTVGGAFELTGNGFGAIRNGTVTSMSGYVTGALENPICQSITLLENEVCPPAGYYECGEGTQGSVCSPGTGAGDEIATGAAPLFGQWALKLNAAASRYYAAYGWSSKFTPPYANCCLGEE